MQWFFVRHIYLTMRQLFQKDPVLLYIGWSLLAIIQYFMILPIVVSRFKTLKQNQLESKPSTGISKILCIIPYCSVIG